MGMSSSGILAYGYDLGGPENGWNFPDLDYGEWLPPGISEDDVDFEFDEWAEPKLLASAGFDEDDESNGWAERRKAARQRIGVEVIHSGSYDYFRAYLVTWHDDGYGFDPKTIDFAELNRQRIEEDWDGKLANAAKVLELPTIMVPDRDYKPTLVQRPHWILTAFYG